MEPITAPPLVQKNRFRLWLAQGFATMLVCARQVLAGGILKAMAANLVRLAQLVVFLLLWRGYAAAGANLGGLTVAQLLTYTLLSFAVRPQLDIISPATSALWEGSLIGRYTRPTPVYVSFIAETVGRWWLPFAAFFALPALLLAPLMGINPLPASALHGLYFAASLFLSAVVGFALDILFAALAMQMKNAVWVITRIREAVWALLSGALIPFALFPGPVATVLSLSPFGSVASAPLQLYIGQGSPARLLGLQLFWAAVAWPLAHLAYKKSEEKVVSYGG